MALKKVRNYYTSSLVSGTWRSEAEAKAAEDVFYASDAGKIQASSEKIQDVLAQQILAQGTASKWSGQGFGSTEANAKDMAKILAGIGITDIKQFGEVKKTVPADIQYTVPGLGVVEKRGDTFYKNESYEYGDGGTSTRSVRLTDAEAKNVKATYGRYVDSFVGEGDNQQYVRNFNPVDPAKIVTKDGVPSIETGETTYGNKATGQQVPNTYSERQTGNAWGGTFAGKGNTGYRVQFATDGTPVFYTTEASSSDLGSVLPLISIALMATGAGAGLGAALMGGSSAAATALGSGIISGVMAEASGGDFVKGAITGAVGSGLGSYAGDIGSVMGITDPAIAQMAGNALLQGASSAASGGEFLDGAIAGALTSGAGQLAGETLGLEGRVASSVGTSLVNGVVAELQGKDVTDAMIAGAVSGALSYKATTGPQTEKEMADSFQKDMEKAGYTSTDITVGPQSSSELSSGFQREMNKLGVSSYDVVKAADEDAATMPSEFGTNEKYDAFMKDAMTEEAKSSIESTISENKTDNTSTPVAEEPFDATEKEGSLAKPSEPDSSIDYSKLIKAGTQLLGTAAIGSAVYSASKPSAAPTPLAPVNLEYGDIYKDAPIKGFSMRKGADGKYTPFIGDKAQLAKGGFISKKPKPTGLASRR